MKQNINEVKRMQQLAGLIKEAQLNENIDVTYCREGSDNSVDTYKAVEFIKQTLINRGYNLPEDFYEEMYEEGENGNLLAIYDPNSPYSKGYEDYPTIDYYETFNEEKAMDIAKKYINWMIEDGDLDAESIEDFKQ